MEKIPTIFKRDDGFRVVDEWTPGCEWVRDGEGVATEKLDGSNVRVTVSVVEGAAWLEKRRNPSKAEKATGAEPGYTTTSRDDPSDKHIWAAFDNTDVLAWGDGVYTCEAIGPKIQGNPLNIETQRLVRHSDSDLVLEASVSRTFDALAQFLREIPSPYAFHHSVIGVGRPMEGIVFHHADGRMAKIKRKDFR